MDSPLLEQRPCPSCPGIIAGADLHRQCIECLGSDRAAANLGPLTACRACRLIPQISRRQRLVQFRDCYVSPVEDPEVDVVEMEDHEEGVPFVFAMPADRAGPLLGERDDDGDTSSSDVSGDRQEGQQHRSAQQDFPAVMTMAAEHVDLSLPPPLPPRPLSRLRQGFYGPARPAQPAFVSPPPARHLAVCGGDMATATEDEGSGGDMGWNPQATRTRSVLVCPPWMKAFGVSLITPQQDAPAPPV